MFHDYQYMAGMHAFGWLFGVAVLIGLIFWALGSARSSRDRPLESPREVLRRRLATGEISTEEYEKRKAVLDRDSQ